MKQILLSFLLLLTCVGVKAQFGLGSGGGTASKVQGVISIKVLDSATRQPVSYASVAVVSSAGKVLNGAVTDNDGKVNIGGITPGKYVVKVAFVGYANKALPAETTPGKPDVNLGTVYLRAVATGLKEVTVQGTKPVIETKIDRMVYNAENDATNSGGDATDVLRKVPMVSVTPDGDLQLRGSAGVRVLIDGKPSGAIAANVGDALKMLPSDQIKSVEVITSPGAKYDAEGATGIINIITKKKAARGINGNVQGTVGTRQNYGGVSLNAKKNRLGFTSNVGAFGAWPQSTGVLFRNDYKQTQGYVSQAGDSKASRYGYNGSAGLSYDFNAYNSLSTNIRLSDGGMTTDGTLNGVMDSAGVQHLFKSISKSDGHQSTIDWTADYKLTTKKEGEELTISGQASYGRNITDVDARRSYDNLPDFISNQHNNGKNNEYTAQADYTRPMGSVKLETGVKGTFRDIKSTYGLTDTGFDYSQNVGAVYVSTNFPIGGGVNAQAGLRGEYTGINWEAGGIKTPEREYFNLFPTAILSKTLSGMNTLKLSYNKRIQRPSLTYLNPFLNNSDPNNRQQGNPNLDPEISHNIELGYNMFFKKGAMLNTSVFYRRTNDIIEKYYEAANSVTTYMNTGVSNSYGTNVFASYNFTPKWTLMSNVSVNSYQLESKVTHVSTPTYFNYQIFGRTAVTLKGGWSGDAFYVYRSKQRTLQGYDPQIQVYGAGLRKDMLNKKLSLGVSILNPFGKYLKMQTRLEDNNFIQQSNINYPIRSFGLTFSYKFGGLKFTETPKNRTNINNDDLKKDQGNGSDMMGGGMQ